MTRSGRGKSGWSRWPQGLRARAGLRLAGGGMGSHGRQRRPSGLPQACRTTPSPGNGRVQGGSCPTILTPSRVLALETVALRTMHVARKPYCGAISRSSPGAPASTSVHGLGVRPPVHPVDLPSARVEPAVRRPVRLNASLARRDAARRLSSRLSPPPPRQGRRSPMPNSVRRNATMRMLTPKATGGAIAGRSLTKICQGR